MNKIEYALSHATDTKALMLGKGVIIRAGELFKEQFPGKRAVLVADPRTYKAAGEQVKGLLDDAGISQDEPFIISDDNLFAEWKFIEMVDSMLSKTDAIPIAVGSGTINDLCKLCSSHNGRRYMVAGTAASMDGYTSYGASITFKGAKQTFSCPAPQAVLADTEIMAAAPGAMVASGYADLFAKVPAGADWIVSDALGIEGIDPFSWGIVQDDLKEALSNPEGARSGNPDAIEPLIEGLILSGFGMQAYRSSRTASGADHQFSHLWDMQHHKMSTGKAPSHGFKVSIGSLMSTALYEQLLSTDISHLDVERCVAAWPSLEAQRYEAVEMFKGTDFPDIGDTEITAKYVDKPALRAQLMTLSNNWENISARIRRQMIPFAEAQRMLSEVGAPTKPEDIGISRRRLRDSVRMAQKIRRRYTILDVALQTCNTERWLDAIFAPGMPWEMR